MIWILLSGNTKLAWFSSHYNNNNWKDSVFGYANTNC